MIYEGDKKTRITLRLTQEQLNFIRGECELLGISPSDYIRMMINSTMSLAKKAQQTIKEGLRRENEKASSNN